MSKRASITDVQALQHFRAKLVKCADEIRIGLADADGEAQRVLAWLDGEAPNHWQLQIRKLHEQVQRAKAAVRDKKTMKTPTGGRPSTAVEEKQLKMLVARLEQAQEKLVACKRWRQQLDKELLAYRGVARRAQGVIEATFPAAVAELDRASTALEQYAAFTAPQAANADSVGSSAGSVARPRDEISPADNSPANPDDDPDDTPDPDTPRSPPDTPGSPGSPGSPASPGLPGIP